MAWPPPPGYGPPPQPMGPMGYGPPVQHYHQGWRCPFCGFCGMPNNKSKISTAGWAVFIVLIFVCFLLCWIGLLMKETARSCPGCGTVVGNFS